MGGTARQQVEKQIAAYREAIGKTETWIAEHSQKVMIESLIDVGSPL
jgi:argininosuccinate lyase